MIKITPEETETLRKNLLNHYPGVRQLLERKARSIASIKMPDYSTIIQYRGYVCGIVIKWSMDEMSHIVLDGLEITPTVPAPHASQQYE